MSPRIWQFTPWLPYEIELKTLVRHCSFLNSAEVFEAWLPALAGGNDPYPVPQLKLTMKQFEVDCFSWESLILVSSRMREVMALPPESFRFFEVDCSHSTPDVQAKGFQVMGIAAREAAVDPDHSEFMLARITPENPPMPVGETRIAIKPDFVPQCDLFYDAFFRGHMFCTDALALRLLRASCAGVRFVDPDHPVGNRMQFRTLRGIERNDWEEEGETMTATVVEEVREQ